METLLEEGNNRPKYLMIALIVVAGLLLVATVVLSYFVYSLNQEVASLKAKQITSAQQTTTPMVKKLTYCGSDYCLKYPKEWSVEYDGGILLDIKNTDSNKYPILNIRRPSHSWSPGILEVYKKETHTTTDGTSITLDYYKQTSNQTMLDNFGFKKEDLSPKYREIVTSNPISKEVYFYRYEEGIDTNAVKTLKEILDSIKKK